MKAKRTIYIMAVFALLVAFISSCSHRRFGHEEFPERMLEHLDDHVEDLNLTESQNTQYQDIKTRLKVDLEKLQSNHNQFKITMKDAVNRDDADLKELTGMVKEKMNRMPETVNVYFDYVDEFIDILNPDQKAIILEELREKVNSRRYNYPN